MKYHMWHVTPDTIYINLYIYIYIYILLYPFFLVLVLVLLSAHVERFSVSCMQDFSLGWKHDEEILVIQISWWHDLAQDRSFLWRGCKMQPKNIWYFISTYFSVCSLFYTHKYNLFRAMVHLTKNLSKCLLTGFKSISSQN